LSESLSRAQLLAILNILEMCAETKDGHAYKHELVTAIADLFRLRDVTFFWGRTYTELFSDPAPVMRGAVVPLLAEYRDQWKEKDLFAAPQVQRTLRATGFVTLSQIRVLPAEQKAYVEGYLLPHRMGVASAIHLTLADGEALVGMFDAGREWESRDMAAIQVLARHLRLGSGRVRGAPTKLFGSDPLHRLTPRQLEVTRLVSTVLTNYEIARALTLSEFTVKKYLSRIFSATGLANRSSLTAAYLQRG